MSALRFLQAQSLTKVTFQKIRVADRGSELQRSTKQRGPGGGDVDVIAICFLTAPNEPGDFIRRQSLRR